MKFKKHGNSGINSEYLPEFAARLAELRKKREQNRNRKLITALSVILIVIIFIALFAVGLPALINSRRRYCGLEAHTHTAECYGDKKELVCLLEECEPHTHTDECYKTEKTLICSYSDKEKHVHTDSCYETRSRLICGEEENEDHTHTEECYEREKVLTCELKEGKVHKHTKGCYREDKTLICELQETEGHKHTDKCYTTVRNALLCSLEEHTHTEQCRSNPEAGAESKGDWENMFSQLELSGARGRDFAVTALSQLGYKEVKKNYLINEDGVRNCYTRYGAWYGTPYADWNAIFAACCLHYAGLDDYPSDGNAAHWVSALKHGEYDLYREADSYVPKTGDLVFFDTDGDTLANRVGVIVRVKLSHKGALKKLLVVEGDRKGEVVRLTYKAGNQYICGYGEMTAASLDPSVKKYDSRLTQSGADYTVTLEYDESALIPDGASLSAEEIKPGTAEYEDYIQRAAAATGTKGDFSFARFFDISIKAGDKVIAPASTVLVTVKYSEPVETDEQWAANAVLLDESSAAVLDVSTHTFADTKQIDTFTFAQSACAVSGTLLGVGADAGYTEKRGTFLKMCTDIADINKKGTYVFVSAQGGYALDCGGEANGAAVPVGLVPIDGNPGYFSLSGSLGDSAKWKFTSADTIYKIKNIGAGEKYIVITSGNELFSTDKSGNSLDLSFDKSQNVWRLSGSFTADKKSHTGYITFDDGSFSKTETADYTCDLQIFSLVEETLRIPVSVAEGSSAKKPEYLTYAPESMAQSGEAALTGGSTGIYYSDKATSRLEQRLTGDTSLDGAVLADKSVVYMHDDYGAFSSYGENTFGVTLSALAQGYKAQSEKRTAAPSDVVFIIDASAAADIEISDGVTGRKAAVGAVNSALEKLFSQSSGNRAGVVIYSADSAVLMPIDRYYVSSEQYNSDSPQSYLVVENGKILTNKSLKNAGGVFERRDNITQGAGAFAQRGIAEATRMFENMPDVTYVTTISSADGIRFNTVYRRPVTVLISGGNSSYCTPDYADALSGAVYGCDEDAALSGANKGISGYYTVLTACAHKAAVSARYKGYSPFYTVGLGIGSDGVSDLSGYSKTGDDFKRTVLDPTEKRVSALKNKSSVNYKTASLQLSELLNGAFDSQSISVGTDGKTHTSVPVTDITDTVYFGNFSYSDGSYFGDFASDELEDICTQLMSSAAKLPQYAFTLAERGCVVIKDTVGVGMKLIAEPVLNYGGRCYSCTSSSEKDGVTSYVYKYEYTSSDGSGFSADLGEIKVSVSSDSVTGAQTVKLTVPDDVMPAYMRSSSGSWYYEALPVRLIYQVGLTDAAKSRIAALSDSSLTFLAGEEGGCEASFTPASDNAFYSEGGGFREESIPKENARTDTAESSCETVRDGSRVLMKLGNNGKLVFNGKNASFNLTVTNEWDDNVDKDDRYELQLALYSKTERQQYAVPVMKGDSDIPLTVVLNDENKWTSVFRDLKYPQEGTEYYLVELNSGSFSLKFTDDGANTGTTLAVGEGSRYYAAKITADKKEKVITVQNGLYNEIPTTGGIGTFTYTFAGICFMLAPLMFGCLFKSRQKRRARRK